MDNGNEEFVIDFGDEKLEVIKEEKATDLEGDDVDKEEKTDEGPENTDKEDIDPEDEGKPDDSPEEKQDESLDDEAIFEKYGDDVKPEIVRHFDTIKDYLYLDENFKFDGKNIDEAYEQDAKYRNHAIAQNLLDILTDKAKTLLSEVLKVAKTGESNKIIGQFFITYKAQRVWGGVAQKPYTTTHIIPSETKVAITCDEFNDNLQKRYNGKCPFNGDINFEVVKIQQRNNY